MRFVAFVVVFACAGAACAQLIGTDFTGTPRTDASVAPYEGGGADDATRQGDGAPGEDVAPGEDATDDTNGPRWAYCELHGGGLCSCSAYDIPIDSGAACDKTTFPGGFCCADPGWPYDSIAFCTCSAWRCHVSDGVCLCGAYGDGGADATCQGTFCCAHDSVYTCGCADAASTACIFGDADTPVASCAEDLQPCPHGGKRVTTCSGI